MQSQLKEYTTTIMPPDFCPEIPEGPEAQAAIDLLVARLPPQEERKPAPTPTVHGRGHALPTVGDDDAALLEKARRFKNGDQFSRLFDHGDISGYPSASEADISLANMLAFLAGPNATRIDGLMRASALLSNPERLKKWDRPHVRGLTYGQATVARAINDTTTTYNPQHGRGRKAPTRKGPDAGEKLCRIEYSPHALPEAMSMLQDALEGKVFQRGGVLVKIVRLPEKSARRGFRRAIGAPIIAPLDVDGLSLLATQVAQFVRYNAKGEPREAAPPADVIRGILAAQGEWKFPVLTNLISCPTLRGDGSVLDAEGYDSRTGLFVDFQGQKFPIVPASPTEKDAHAALEVLESAIDEFPFTCPAAQSVALAGMLTAPIRASLGAVPMFAPSATTPGSGKSTLGDFFSIIATGRPAAALDFTADENEFKKSLFAVLLEGAAVTMIDNIVGDMNSSLLNIILSQETVKGRILGASKTAEVPTTSLWIATGNNLRISGDLTRRTLLCEMDANMERPAERIFSRDLYKWGVENRPQLVVACLTILKAFLQAGKPGAKDLKRMNGFNDWSELVRGALVWLGRSDPLETQAQIESADPEREMLSGAMSSWWDCLGDRPVTTSDLLQTSETSAQRVKMYQALVAAVNGRHGINGRNLGKWLSKYQGRIVQGLKIVGRGTYNKQALWSVQKVSAN